MKLILTSILCLALIGCGTMTPAQQAQTSQTVANAAALTGQLVAIYASTPGAKISPTQAQQVNTLIAATTPVVQQLASDSLYGAAAMGQAGVPVSQGTPYTLVGQSIQSNTPALSPNATAALLQTVASAIPTK